MLTGSCACGAVAYEADGLDGSISHCHCNTCRKTHSAAYATTARVLRSRFRWTKGEDRLGHFASSPGKTRHFCASCGSHLVAEREGQGHVIVRVASLDTDPGARPIQHIWTSHDALWLTDEGDLPRYTEWEPGR